MDRKKILKNGLLGMGAIVALPTVITSCSKDDDDNTDPTSGDCIVSPEETNGPYPILTL